MLISKSGKALGTRQTFTKIIIIIIIKKNPDRPTLLANSGSSDGKRTFFKSSLSIKVF